MRLIKFALPMMALLATTAEAQPRQTGDTKLTPKPFRLSVKVGWATGAADPRGPQAKQPLVDPIEGATVLLIDKAGLVIGVRNTDKEGLTYWPPQQENFSASVAVVGHKVESFKFQGGEATASVLIRLTRK